MTPGPTNTQMLDRAEAAEEQLAMAEGASEEAQQAIGSLKDALEDIDTKAQAMAAEIHDKIADFQGAIIDLRRTFADL